MKKLNSNQLKLIAIIAMTIDHIAWAFLPAFSTEPLHLFMHIIGRITCPIMCFFVAEGFYFTKNINKYTFRLFLFAFISHFPYMLLSNGFLDYKSLIPFFYGSVLNQTSVIWPLAWGLVMLRVSTSDRIKKQWLKDALILLICVAAFPGDWSCVASLCVLAIGLNRGNFKKQMLSMVFFVFTYSIVYFFTVNKVYGVIQMFVVLSIPLLYLYNGKRGDNIRINTLMKWLFYLYYPVHLLVIWFVSNYIY